MDSLKTIYRYISGNNEGLVGKINQHKNNFVENMNNVPNASSILSNNILKRLDNNDIIAKHRGSIGVIYVGYLNGKKIAIKVVPENVKKIVMQDLSIFKMFNLIGLVNFRISELSEDISMRLKLELSMRNELNNYKLLNKFKFSEYNMRLLNVHENLCTDKYFIYDYEDCENLIKNINGLDDKKRLKIYKRILDLFFQIQMNNLFLGDLNEGNFLYDKEADEIILIDYGSVIKTTNQFRLGMDMIMYNLLYCKNVDYLKNKLCNGSEKFGNLLKKIQYILSDTTIDLNNLDINVAIFDFNALYGGKLRREAITVLRSLSHLLLLGMKFNICANLRKIFTDNNPFDGNIQKYQPDNINYYLE